MTQGKPNPFSTRLLAAIFLAAAMVALNLRAAVVADELKVPTATQLEQSLRAHLAQRNETRAAWQSEPAVLEAFRLEKIERVSATQWDADLELSFDYGPEPRSLVGFQRSQTGPYFLRVEQTESGLKVLRFDRAGRVQPLPSPVRSD